MPNSDGSEVLDINTGGKIISATRDTLTQIKGKRLEALFSGRWDKQFLRDEYGRVFRDINTKWFRTVVDYLNKRKITPLNSPLEITRMGEGEYIILQHLLISFGLVDDSVSQSKILFDKTKLGTVIDEHSNASKYQWENITFENFPKETPHDIQTVLK